MRPSGPALEIGFETLDAARLCPGHPKAGDELQPHFEPVIEPLVPGEALVPGDEDLLTDREVAPDGRGDRIAKCAGEFEAQGLSHGNGEDSILVEVGRVLFEQFIPAVDLAAQMKHLLEAAERDTLRVQSVDGVRGQRKIVARCLQGGIQIPPKHGNFLQVSGSRRASIVGASDLGSSANTRMMSRQIEIVRSQVDGSCVFAEAANALELTGPATDFHAVADEVVDAVGVVAVTATRVLCQVVVGAGRDCALSPGVLCVVEVGLERAGCLRTLEDGDRLESEISRVLGIQVVTAQVREEEVGAHEGNQLLFSTGTVSRLAGDASGRLMAALRVEPPDARKELWEGIVGRRGHDTLLKKWTMVVRRHIGAPDRS
ncbi:MAG: hypothetical protein AB7O52_05675 [Planctomycetota bacterium]